MTSRPDSALMTAALGYARAGWRVFPCRRKDKSPWPGKDVDPATGEKIPNSGGLRKASTDPEQIRAWWTKWPDAMIGAVTGPGMNAFVVDPDAYVDAEGEVHDRGAQLQALEQLLGVPLPETPMVITPGGGCHLYFALPELPDGVKLGNRDKGLPFKINVRGDDTGYVIVPPSVNAEGRAYEWVKRYSEVPLAPAPATLVQLLTAPPPAPAGGSDTAPKPSRSRDSATGDAEEDAVRRFAVALLSKQSARVAAAPEGERGSTLNICAHTLGGAIGAGILSQNVVEAELLYAADRSGLLAKDGRERVLTIMRSGISTGEAKPLHSAVDAVRAEARERAQRTAGRSARPRAASGGALPARDTPREPASAGEASGRSPPDAAAPPAAPAPRAGVGFDQPSQMGGAAPTPLDGGRGGAAKDDDADLDGDGAFLPQTDLGNAERWCARHGSRFRHSSKLGWLAWDGRRWSREDADTLLSHSIYATVRAIGDEAVWLAAAGEAFRADHPYDEVKVLEGDAAPDPRDPDPYSDIKRAMRRSDKLRGWGRTSENAARIAAIRTLAIPMVAVLPEAFDRDPLKFNLLNGTLTFLRPTADYSSAIVRLDPHDPADLITKLAPVEFDGHADCPEYDRFFSQVQPEKDKRRMLHGWGGYNMTGDTEEQAFMILHGATGGNGKSTWMNALAAIMGDYASSVPVQTFLDQGTRRKGGDATPDIAELPGQRMVFASEPPRGAKLGEELIKLITGGEKMKARHLNKDFFNFVPVMKLSIVTNPKLELSDDKALWRRVIYSEWIVSIPPAERDKGLPKKLLAESSGILNRMIEGVKDWLEHGLWALVPESVKAATEQYHDERDPLGRFIELCIKQERGERVQSSTMFEVYKAWSRWAGEKEWTQTGFSTAMANRGFTKKQSNNIVWLDLKLLKQASDFPDPNDRRPWDGGGGHQPWIGIDDGDDPPDRDT